jgi:hypothetical protein
MDELTLLLEVLLGLGRGDALAAEPVTMEGMLQEAVLAAGLDGRFVVSVQGAPHEWLVPRREAGLLLQDLLRRLASGVAAGALWLHAAPDELVLTLVPSRTDEADAQPGRRDDLRDRAGGGVRGEAWARADRGSRRTLMIRLAALMGWRIALQTDAAGVRVARVRFDAGPA